MSPQLQELVDISNEYLYSTRLFVAGSYLSKDYPLFIGGLGSTEQGYVAALDLSMTEAETNLMRGGMLPDSKAFNVRSIGIWFDNVRNVQEFPTEDDVVEMNNFLKKTVLIYKQETREDIMGPLLAWPAGFGIDWRQESFMLAAANDKNVVANNGMPGVIATKRFDIPIQIAGGKQFQFNLKATREFTFTNDTEVGLFAWGESGKVLGEVETPAV